MSPESSRPAVPPHLTAAGREPQSTSESSRMAPVWAYVFLLVLLALATAVWFGAPYLWELIRP